MLKLKKVAITGGAASGKSTVCQFFQKLGAFVVSADEIVHELFMLDIDLGQQVVSLLGRECIIDGKLSRRAIADKVFNNPRLLHALEELTHPRVFSKIEELHHAAEKRGGYTFFIAEVPLVYEIGKNHLFDSVVTVTSPESLAKKRFCVAGFTEEEYERRMKRQWSSEEKASHADYVIHNNGSLAHLREQVIHLNHLLKNP